MENCQKEPPPYSPDYAPSWTIPRPANPDCVPHDGHPAPSAPSGNHGHGKLAVIFPVPDYDGAPSAADSRGGSPGAQPDCPPGYTAGLELDSDNCFSDKGIRRAFVRKVYLTLMVQLIITVGIICMFLYWKTLNKWVREQYWFTYGCLCAVFVLIIVLACCAGVRRKVPMNFIFLGLFTVAEGLTLGSVTVFFDAEAVMWAVGATALVCFSLSVFAMQSKWDFTTATGTMWVIGWSLVSFGLLYAIIRTNWLYIVYAAVGTLVFSVYLVMDTQLMLGGKHKYSLSPEEYIFAALNLYLDIVTIFLFILQLIGLSR